MLIFDKDGKPGLDIEYRERRGNYDIVCVLQRMGHRCGYVGITNKHPYFGKNYEDEKIVNIDVHGGMTYADTNRYFNEDKTIWYFGFDCAHCWDANDFDALRKAGMETENTKRIEEIEKMYSIDGEVRTLDYVKAECEKLYKALKKLEEGTVKRTLRRIY